MNKILEFLGSLPYRCGVRRERMSPTAYFWARQGFHLLGGIVVGSLAALLSLPFPVAAPLVWGVVGGVMLGILTYGEEQDEEGGQAKYKTITDVLIWLLGYGFMLGLTL